MITFEDIRSSKTVQTYITKADEALKAIGYTEHSFPHVTKVAVTAGEILESLGYDETTVELTKIAGYLHDIGNLINRVDHAESGAMMAFRMLDHLDMPAEDVATVVSAIGNHDEGTGYPINSVAAALILADKADVRRSRVRNTDIPSFDIHDRVNYSVKESSLKINDDKTVITLYLDIDTALGSIMDYFEIFLNRMLMCRKAAEALKLKFSLVINGQIIM
ncbi:MAG: HD domain-containing protein [Clostridia bacterium]|jgi:putative nucleotidyltransferase with HDIG domain|nr:HD domain-containing protein [Clostridia bacterium]